MHTTKCINMFISRGFFPASVHMHYTQYTAHLLRLLIHQQKVKQKNHANHLL